jgi:CheY-like chemotaxis protein
VEQPEAEEPSHPGLDAVRRNLDVLAPAARQAFLLISVEEFSPSEAATILDVDESELQELIDEAGREIARQIATDVVIIEDEPLIALDLERLVTELGHRVVKIARTERQAIEAVMRAKPGLILADIQLADGSSGLDAVNEILRSFSVPVIFVTAYPQRLLTGTRPEPTFLIAKPFPSRQRQGGDQPGAVLRHPRPPRAAAHGDGLATSRKKKGPAGSHRPRAPEKSRLMKPRTAFQLPIERLTCHRFPRLQSCGRPHWFKAVNRKAQRRI